MLGSGINHAHLELPWTGVGDVVPGPFGVEDLPIRLDGLVIANGIGAWSHLHPWLHLQKVRDLRRSPRAVSATWNLFWESVLSTNAVQER